MNEEYSRVELVVITRYSICDILTVFVRNLMIVLSCCVERSKDDVLQLTLLYRLP